ncbi:MAG: hypothetical protein MMC33_004949 [Icmadophila ericetorum]|nr:hypothetical protein [Icmadophila ericetorum]
MSDAASIEAVNKVRLAVGLKPLPVPGAPSGPVFKESNDDESSSEEEQGSTLESRQAQGYENWKKLQDEADAKAQREAKNEAIKKARDVARKNAKLEGKGLGEADDVTELDTKSWLLQQKKRQKKLDKERARKLEQELREREVAEYTAADLSGVKVGHELADFEEGGEQVLTLKDTTIDENEEEGDELENVELKEKEKLRERLDLKKKKPVYDPTEEDASGQNVILKHYDETIDGKKRKRFTLDAQGSTVEERDAMKQGVGAQLKAQAITLDLLEDTTISDYVDASEIKIRKPKKAKKSRQKAVDEDDIFPSIENTNGAGQGADSMDIDNSNSFKPAAPSRSYNGNVSFVDDDDLQASLAKQRREALKKRKKIKPEDLARQLREESANPTVEDTMPEEGGLVIDETSEFVANLQPTSILERQRRPSVKSKAKSMSPSAADEEGDVDMERSYNDVEDEEDLAARQKRQTSNPADLPTTGLEEESTLTTGIGSTLSLLTQRGLLKPQGGEDLNALHRDRQRFLTEKQKREAAADLKARAQRERDRASGKLDRMSAREREEYARWENKQRDQAESRLMTEIFNREYKPDVQLKYVDDFGREMGQKEAFKHLSHQFHGKGSGKLKTEKYLKKIEEEKRREAQSSLDSSAVSGLGNAVGQAAKKQRTAGVRLA